MHLSIALLATAVLGALAGPTPGNARAPVVKKPSWASTWNGRCTSTRFATRTITSTKRTTKSSGPTTTVVPVLLTTTQMVTLPQVTDVFSTTSTFYTGTTATASTTVYETAVVTATTNMAPPASTIPAPAGFTPIGSVYPSSAPTKRSLDLRAAANPVCVRPGDLKCKTTIYTTITKATKTRYTTIVATQQPSTITSSSTSIITTTTSVLPVPASSTITFSTTSTVDQTVTNTATSTSTSTVTSTIVSGAAPTTYAACAPNNILDSYNGGFVNSLYFGPPGGSVFLGSAASSYDCCVLCLNNSNCAGAGYLGGTCIGITPDVSCDGSSGSGFFGAGASADQGWSVSNSGCGQWKFQTQ